MRTPLPGAVGSDGELEWKEVPKSGSTNPWLEEEAFYRFYLSAVVNMERVLLCTSSLLGSWSISQLSPRAGRTAQCPLLEEEEEAGWS